MQTSLIHNIATMAFFMMMMLFKRKRPSLMNVHFLRSTIIAMIIYHLELGHVLWVERALSNAQGLVDRVSERRGGNAKVKKGKNRKQEIGRCMSIRRPASGLFSKRIGNALGPITRRSERRCSCAESGGARWRGRARARSGPRSPTSWEEDERRSFHRGLSG